MNITPDECWLWEEFDRIAEADLDVQNYLVEPARELLENV